MVAAGGPADDGTPPGGSPSNETDIASLDLVSVLQDIKGELRRLSDEVNTMKSNPALRMSTSIQHVNAASEDLLTGSRMSSASVAAAANLANIMSDNERTTRRRSLGTRESGAMHWRSNEKRKEVADRALNGDPLDIGGDLPASVPGDKPAKNMYEGRSSNFDTCRLVAPLRRAGTAEGLQRAETISLVRKLETKKRISICAAALGGRRRSCNDGRRRSCTDRAPQGIAKGTADGDAPPDEHPGKPAGAEKAALEKAVPEADPRNRRRSRRVPQGSTVHGNSEDDTNHALKKFNARLLAEDVEVAGILAQLKRAQLVEAADQQREESNRDRVHSFDWLSCNSTSYTLDPRSSMNQMWRWLVVICALYSAAMIPIRIAFADIYDDVDPVYIAVDVVFVVDILVTLMTGVESKDGRAAQGLLIRSRRAIASRYAVSGEMAVDILGAISLDHFLRAEQREHPELRLLLIFKAFRLARLSRSFGSFQAKTSLGGAAILTARIAFLVACLVVIIHWFGCIWLLVGATSGEYAGYGDGLSQITGVSTPETEQLGDVTGESGVPERAFIQRLPNDAGEARDPRGVLYAEGFYWAIMMLTGLGVEFLPATVMSTVYEVMVAAVGVVMYAYFLGSATTAITSMNASAMKRKKRLDEMREFLRRRRVPERLRQAVVDHCDHMLDRQQALDELAMIQSLPQSLKLQLDMVLNSKFLVKVPMFRYCDPRCLITLVQCMRSSIFLPGDVIVCEGMPGTALYFVAKGRVTVLVGTDEVAWLSDFDFFGEQSFLDGTRVGASVVSEGLSEIMLLFRTDFLSILQYFPELREHVERCQQQQLEKYARIAEKLKKSNRSSIRRSSESQARRSSSSHLPGVALKRCSSKKSSELPGAADDDSGSSHTAAFRGSAHAQVAPFTSTGNHNNGESTGGQSSVSDNPMHDGWIDRECSFNGGETEAGRMERQGTFSMMVGQLAASETLANVQAEGAKAGKGESAMLKGIRTLQNVNKARGAFRALGQRGRGQSEQSRASGINEEVEEPDEEAADAD